MSKESTEGFLILIFSLAGLGLLYWMFIQVFLPLFNFFWYSRFYFIVLIIFAFGGYRAVATYVVALKKNVLFEKP